MQKEKEERLKKINSNEKKEDVEVKPKDDPLEKLALLKKALTKKIDM